MQGDGFRGGVAVGEDGPLVMPLQLLQRLDLEIVSEIVLLGDGGVVLNVVWRNGVAACHG